MLEFRNVDVNIGRTCILKDISISFKKGKITTLAGPNGCGKTTLLQALNGVSKVSTGDIFLDSELYLKLPMRERAKRLSFMPQFRENVPCIPVKGFVEHGRFPYMGFSRKMSSQDTEIVEKALAFTGVAEYRHSMVNELSGGVIQRVYLAMQLAQDSSYMVLDEPMNFLDFPGQREMLLLIKRLRDEGRTVILVLHDLNQALQVSDEIVIMKERKIIASGTPAECIRDDLIGKVFDCSVRQVEVQGEKHYLFE